MKPFQTLVLTTVALAVLIGGGWYFLGKNLRNEPPIPANDSLETTTVQKNKLPQVSLQTPEYMKPIAFSPDISAEIRSRLTESLQREQEAIAKNSLDLGAWTNLGAIYKIAGDYASAQNAWEFVLSVVPNSASTHYNLGDLYQNWLKDYPKAEEHYLAVIKSSPHHIEAYVNLYTMYRYQYRMSTSSAMAIILEGIQQNPGNERLLSFKQELEG